jgi:hypothetical protein
MAMPQDGLLEIKMALGDCVTLRYQPSPNKQRTSTFCSNFFEKKSVGSFG